MQEPPRSWIYVLKLRDGCYYVGRSQNPKLRIRDHKVGRGSDWTNLHPVEHISELFEETSLEDEDNTVKRLMKQHGIDKVRGGSYSQINLNPAIIGDQEREHRGANDECFRCGYDDHFIRNCREIYDIHGEAIEDD